MNLVRKTIWNTMFAGVKKALCQSFSTIAEYALKKRRQALQCALVFVALGGVFAASAPDVYAQATLYRSVGLTTANLNVDSRTMTISGTIATFSGAMPDNIGVGDVLQYQVAGTYYVAFIAARTSSTVYEVQDNVGGTPTAAVAGTVVNVYRAHLYLSYWEAQTEGLVNSSINANVDEDVLLPSTDLTSATGDDFIAMVACYNDDIDFPAVTVLGWTTSASNYIKIYTPTETTEVGTSQRHDGTWGTGYRRTDYLYLREEYVRVEGLSTKMSQNQGLLIANATGTGEIHVSDTYIQIGGIYTYDAFYIATLGSITIKLWNNIAINHSTNAAAHAFYIADPDITVYAYNNTAISNSGSGFNRTSGAVTLKNNIAYSYGTGSSYVGTFTAVDYSASDDATADDWGGTGNRINQTFSFVYEAGDDYHLSQTDTGALDVGTDLSADGNIAFATDIDGDTRPYNVTWDMGADESVADSDAITISNLTSTNVGIDGFDASIDFTGDDNADATSTFYYCNNTDSPGCNPALGISVAMTRKSNTFEVSVSNLVNPNDSGDTLNIRVETSDGDGVTGSPLTSTLTLGRVLYRSVGAILTDLNVDTRTVTVTGTLATFSGPMPDNVGVGDVLQYQSASVYHLTFISRRISDTVYHVQSQDGTTPTAVSGVAVSVYRAHYSLQDWEDQTIGDVNLTINNTVDEDGLLPSTDLVSDRVVVMVAVYADGLDPDGAVNISGWTTGPRNYIKIFAPTETYHVGTSQRHDGTWGSGYRRSNYLRVSESYVRLDGISIKDGAYYNYFVYAITDVGEVHISNSFGHFTGATAHDSYYIGTVAELTVKMWNNIGISDSTHVTSHAFYLADADASIYSYNSTGVSNSGNAFDFGTAKMVHLKNNIGYSYGSGSAFNGAFTSVEYSASDDATADDQGGAGNRINQTFSFVDEAGDDYHLTSSDTGALDVGSDLSADGTIAFSYDIDTESRPSNVVWDIGADEYVSAGDSITISNLVTTNVGVDAFDVSIDFTGDDNANATSTFYYCNSTASPGCDPTAGTSVAMLRSSGNFDVSVTGLVPPNNNRDSFNVRVITLDADGVTGSPLNGTVTLASVLYRSVGITTSDLNTDSRTLTITGTMATFSGDMPNNVGVGDVLQYQVASVYNVAFITRRISSTVYEVQDNIGGIPTAAVGGTAVNVYRAHDSLDDWEDQVIGDVNTSIHADVDDDVLLPSTDLVADRTVIMVSCYDDGEDGLAAVVDGWTTGARNYISIYSPTETTEVGISQRHSGTWGDGYRRPTYLYVYDEYVRVDGIAIKAGGVYPLFIYNSAGAGEIHLSNNFVHQTGSTAHEAIYVGNLGANTVKIWNNIAITDSTDATSYAYFLSDGDVTYFVYNNTGISNSGTAFYRHSGSVTMKNNLGYSYGSGAAFGGVFASVDYCASDDATADDWGGTGNRINQTFTFVDEASDDFHIDETDVGALDVGSDLSADGTIAFSEDIDEQVRPYNAIWDIGADEFVSLGDATTVSNLVTSNIGPLGFDVSIDYVGDDNEDASSTLYYCNETDSPGCDPTTGTSLAMNRVSSKFEANVIDLSSPNDPGDTLNIRVVTTDADGVTGSPLDDTVMLGQILYRSVGLTTANLNVNARTVTITGTLATFSGAMPDNVGVGDVLQYQVAATYYVAFISGRTSSTVYTIQDRSGGIPTAAVAGTAVNIYRAHIYLNYWESQSVGTVNSGINAAVDDDVVLPSTDLTSNNTIVKVACYSGAIDFVTVAVLGWTTGSNNYIEIYTPTETSEVGTSQRHSGTWESGYRRNAYLWLYEEYVRVKGIAIKQSDQSSLTVYGSTGTGEVHISENFVQNIGSNAFDAYSMYNIGDMTVKLWNNIGINDSTNVGAHAFYFGDTDLKSFAYNNTGVANAGSAFFRDFGAVTLKNNLGYSYGAGAGFAGSFDSVEYSASHDATADDWGGSGNRINQTFAFEYAPDSNYRLSLTDTGALDVGTDLSVDGTIAITTDMDGYTRPYNVTWDIGADEAVADTDAITISNLATTNVGTTAFDATIDFTGDDNENATSTFYYCNETDSPGCNPTTGTSVAMTRKSDTFEVNVTGLSSPNDPGDTLNIRVITSDGNGVTGSPLNSTVILGRILYRSVGVTATDLNVDSRTVTISGTLATFSGAMPDNVGVGDVLQYQVAATYYVAFISGRTSSTVYTVQNRTGGNPTAAVGGTAVSVYRAHNSLQDWDDQTVADVNASIHADVDQEVLLNSTNLVTDRTTLMVSCYADGEDGEGAAYINSWTTSSNNYIKVYTPTQTSEVGTSQRHTGVWGTGYRRIELLGIYNEYVRLEGLSSKHGNNYIYFIYSIRGPGEIHISECYGHFTGLDGRQVFHFSSVGELVVKMWNNIAINESTNASSHAIYIPDGDITVYSYNNTAVANAGNAFSHNYATSYMTNNLGYNSGSGASFGGVGYTEVNYCSSDDATSDDWGGAGNRINQTFSFVSEAADNYHLLGTDTGAIDVGTDLSADGTLAFSDDVDLETRPYNALWDIGYDEYVDLGDIITISNLLPANVGVDTFDVSIDFSGDDNIDATTTLYYCNETDSPGCDPTTGTSVVMMRNATTYTTSVTGLTDPNNPGDTLNIRVITTDPDGVVGSPLNSTVTLGYALYRSVGLTATDLNTSTRTVTISGTLATFSGAMPDNVGVGDVLQYQVAATYYVAFISGRTSDTVYTVQNQTGVAPTAAVAGTAVNVYRAHTSLQNWEDQVVADVNTNIHADVDDDVLISGTDLVTDNVIVVVSTYADGEDPGGSVLVSGWTTGPNNYIKIYTPIETNEVGTSQRHDGTWGTGYRRVQTLRIQEEYVRIEGLSIQNNVDDGIQIGPSTGEGLVEISHSYSHYTGTGLNHAYYFVTLGAMTGKLWNNIGITDSTNAGSHAFFVNDDDITVYAYNNTGIANVGSAFRVDNGFLHLKNSLGYSSGSTFVGVVSSSEYCSSDDATADDWGGDNQLINQTIKFIDMATDNYHLTDANKGALNKGKDLTADMNISYNDDIVGQSRPIDASWDIGCEEVMERVVPLKGAIMFIE